MYGTASATVPELIVYLLPDDASKIWFYKKQIIFKATDVLRAAYQFNRETVPYRGQTK